MNIKDSKTKIHQEYTLTQKEFHKLLGSLSKEDLQRKSHNAGWTNGEILFHMFLGFIVVSLLFPLVKIFSKLPKSWSKAFANMLNFSTPLFNFLNALGARVGGRVFTLNMLNTKFDQTTNGLIKKMESLKADEWKNGMYAPTKWDGLFEEYMPMEKLFMFPIKHFNFHTKQIKRELKKSAS